MSTRTGIEIKERPILFSGPMVRAILTCAKCGHLSVPFPCEKCGSTEFCKTQTRRVVKPQPRIGTKSVYRPFTSEPNNWQGMGKDTIIWYGKCRYGVPGDRLWVRETFWHQPEQHDSYPGMGSLKVCDEVTVYRADVGHDEDRNFAWRPSIHMPRWASRITLEITDVHVQRVQEITEEDAKAEGIERAQSMFLHGGYRLYDDDATMTTSAVQSFRTLWDSINAKRGFGFDANPWVWALTFRRVA